MTTAKLTAIHETDKQRFIVKTSGGESTLSYHLDGQAIDFNSTYVCPNDRGTKVGVTLLQAAVGWAQAEAFSISASCWYVARYLEKHPS